MKAEELRKIRERLGWTQAELAEAVGVAPNSVARWERGEMAIRESAARLIQSIAAGRQSKKTGGRK
jgi:transcriptional regulator with XRE-family HTH domain